MPAKSSTTGFLEPAVSAVLADNPELASRLKNILVLAVADMERAYRIGGAEALAYSRMVMPLLFKGLQATESGSQELKDAFDRVLGAVRGGGAE